MERFTKQSVIDWLKANGGKAIMGTEDVSRLLRRSQQMIRRYAKAGRLKCDMAVYNRAVYSIEDVAEFLLAHPQICVCNREMMELTPETDELISRIGFKYWKPLLDACGADDVFQEVRMRFIQTRKVDNSKIGAVINRLFSNIYRKYRRTIDSKPFDENRNIDGIESNVNLDIEDDEQVIRAEAVRLMNAIPIEFVRAFLRHCPKKI